MYFVHMGHYNVKVTACDEETLLMTIWRDGQSISTYHNAQTLKEDKARTQIERRAAYAETVRNAILEIGLEGCRELIDAWRDFCRDEHAVNTKNNNT